MKIKNFLRKPSQTFASLRKSQLVSTLILSSFLFGMAFFLQSQTSGCCSTPTGTIDAIPNAIGTLYLPPAQPSGTNCQPNISYLQNTPSAGQNVYLLNAGSMVQTSGEYYFKVEVITLDGCYKSVTYYNPTNTNAASGYGIKVKYPTETAYGVTVYLQKGINSICTSGQAPGVQPEWKITYDVMTNNITWNESVRNAIFGTSPNSIPGVYKFVYNGMIPFGQNVLN